MSAVKAVTSFFKRIREQGDQLNNDLTEVRRQVARWTEEVERIQRLPRPREEAEAEIRSLVEAGAKSFDVHLGDFSRPGAANLIQLMQVLNGGSGAMIGAGAIQRNTFGFMCAVAPAGMFELLSRKLDDAYATGPGVTAAERAALLAKADAHLLEMSLVEEAIIRACEGAGMAVLRRPDADPRAVLAPDSALPN